MIEEEWERTRKETERDFIWNYLIDFRKFLQKDRDHNENKAIASFVLSLPFNLVIKDDHILPGMSILRMA